MGNLGVPSQVKKLRKWEKCKKKKKPHSTRAGFLGHGPYLVRFRLSANFCLIWKVQGARDFVGFSSGQTFSREFSRETKSNFCKRGETSNQGMLHVPDPVCIILKLPVAATLVNCFYNSYTFLKVHLLFSANTWHSQRSPIQKKNSVYICLLWAMWQPQTFLITHCRSM